MLPRELNKYTNYNAYVLCVRQGAAHEVDEKVLCELIGRLRKKYKNPYIRFMWKANTEDAMCILYDGEKRLTKLITFNQLNEEEQP